MRLFMNHSKRNINIDIIKALSLFLVISVHFFLYTEYYTIAFNSLSLPFIAIRNICMACVPLFIMVTGYLNRNKVWSKKYYLNISRVYLLYSLAIFILTLVSNKYVINTTLFKTTLINILNYNYYGWYINMYVGLMLIAPIINLAFKNIDESTRKYAVINTILAISIPVTLADIFSNIRYSIFAHTLPNWWYYTWPIMYYIIGVAFSHNKNILRDFFSNSKILFLVTLIISTLLYWFLNIHWEFRAHVNIFIVIITTCIFSWLLNLDINVNSKLRTGIMFVSNNTLLAYLLSYIIDNINYPLVNHISNITMRFSLFPIVVILNFILTILLVIIVRIILSVLSKSIRLVRWS